MKLVFDSEIIEIDPEPNELFHAKVMLDNNRLSFKKGYISFSTDLGDLNPFRGVENFDIKNSQVEIAKTGITMNSYQLDMIMAGVSLGLKNVSLVCDSEGDYTTDIDDVCLKKSTLRKLKNGTGDPSLSIKDLNSTFPLDLTLIIKELNVLEKNIQAKAQNVNGKIYETFYNLDETSFTCYKQPGQTDLDPELLLMGCMEESSSYFKNFSSSKKDLTSSISNAHFNITKEKFQLVSDSAEFVSGVNVNKKDKTMIEHLEIQCKKSPLKAFAIERNKILSGCLEDGVVRVSKIHVDQEKALELVEDHNQDLYKQISKETNKLNFFNFKDITLSSKKGHFTFKAKGKFLFRIPVKITGKSTLQEENNILTLTVDKATVLGIPSRRLALYLVKKFVANEDVQINENTISIKM